MGKKAWKEWIVKKKKECKDKHRDPYEMNSQGSYWNDTRATLLAYSLNQRSAEKKRGRRRSHSSKKKYGGCGKRRQSNDPFNEGVDDAQIGDFRKITLSADKKNRHQGQFDSA